MLSRVEKVNASIENRKKEETITQKKMAYMTLDIDAHGNDVKLRLFIKKIEDQVFEYVMSNIASEQPAASLRDENDDINL